ncbi:Sas10 C-terminal domain [Teratosphaeria destructans]|uniref:Sas10 C-terminal domain n=1 Tax=Teratosphaeria destructans TaxID=418781 RepID=A0A9W7W4C0_9PEZI|nr:Sas10 C-terminal domain [Teratosphaeria destructans]
MGKRKRTSKTVEEPKGPDMEVGLSRKRIQSYEDVADSDDKFHMNRDEILLGDDRDTKRRRKAQEAEEFIQPSDEEVLDYSEDEVEDSDDQAEYVDARDAQQDSASVEEDNGEDEDDLGGWGTSKADLYGADEIETEEQALEEEAEALRLQKKQLQQMSEADYGFDESDWQRHAKDEGVGKDVVTEFLPQLQITEDMGPAEKLKLLKSRYPEFEPLSKEFLSLQELHAALTQEVKSVVGSATFTQTPAVITKLRAASAYLGALTMYFSLLTSTAWESRDGALALSANQLRDHPIMDSLVQCRDLWQKASALPGDQRDVDNQDSEEEASEEDIPELPVQTKVRKTSAQRHQSAAQARRAERIAKTEADLANLDALLAPRVPRNAKTKRAADEDDSDLGEEAPLTAREAEEKAQRKKSLRFYTSQIAQKANKRGTSGRNAGGDEDVPHRERLRDRQARLNAEAEKRGKGKDGDAAAALGGESDDDDARQAKQIRSEVDEDDYYDLVAARTAKKKSDKAALAEAQRQAALSGSQVREEGIVGADGKRKISYIIEKNKGLTPFRKKDVRNPRVKKRKKYDEKKKKLASMKPVYKGGEGRGGYGGELTGIKKGLVKSTKL